MNAIEGRVSHAEDELATFFEHDVGGAGDEVVAHGGGDGGKRAHRAGNDDHGVDTVAARSDLGADVFVRSHINLLGARPRMRLGSFFRSPEVIPSSSEKS